VSRLRRGLAGRIIAGRPRLFSAIAIGIIASLIPWHLRPQTRFLVAWDIGAFALLVLCALLFSSESEHRMERDAAAQEEGEWTIFSITIIGTIASFVALTGEFSDLKSLPPAVRGGHVALVAVTLLFSWLVTHTLFALRYAHEYYERKKGAAAVDGGLEFPGGLPPDYWDFFYFALVLGMTFQVSDVEITTRKMRRLATMHGLLGFLFNAVIIALTVNIAAGLL
jgi:uncharacterized membrane protein